MQNIGKLMKQAQAMQKKMQEMQDKMAEAKIEGQSGGGLVKFTMTGKGEPVSIDINDELLLKEEKAMLQDLIIAAIQEAKKKADEEFSGGLGGLEGMAGGLKLPF